ncbi:hypothetical protein TUM19329_09300 [Legionella antarctica]|uniref:Uncharacterized protein n=1 Tax=Legionella antarctica TaxID=2708020 RepID=A0A6F8T2B3_9GAMM|nr:acyl-CoA dehydrogenase family protein [Legionella antarctica]BCA94569.1 hypothetical protein TUM19329_09300 [Legionella antarctica]
MAKLYTAKQAIAVVSEALEAFGGAGYVEDTGLPQLLRDAQVLSIWEGTTNILSLDVLRAIRKENAGEPLLQDIVDRMVGIDLQELASSKERTLSAVANLKEYMNSMSTMSEESQQVAARRLAFSMAQTYAASLLLEHANWAALKGANPLAAITAIRWCSHSLTQVLHPSEAHCNESRMLGLDVGE